MNPFRSQNTAKGKNFNDQQQERKLTNKQDSTSPVCILKMSLSISVAVEHTANGPWISANTTFLEILSFWYHLSKCSLNSV